MENNMENQWKLMETAQKDGSKFLMFITGMEYEKNKYDKKYKAKTIQKVLIADYWPHSNSFFGEDGDFIIRINEFNFKEKDYFASVVFGYQLITDVQATHWMPLPKPPITNN